LATVRKGRRNALAVGVVAGAAAGALTPLAEDVLVVAAGAILSGGGIEMDDI